MSARTYHRTRGAKLARTIADLAECVEIQSAHLAEALHLRPSEVNAGVIQAKSKNILGYLSKSSTTASKVFSPA